MSLISDTPQSYPTNTSHHTIISDTSQLYLTQVNYVGHESIISDTSHHTIIIDTGHLYLTPVTIQLYLTRVTCI